MQRIQRQIGESSREFLVRNAVVSVRRPGDRRVRFAAPVSFDHEIRAAFGKNARRVRPDIIRVTGQAEAFAHFIFVKIGGQRENQRRRIRIRFPDIGKDAVWGMECRYEIRCCDLIKGVFRVGGTAPVQPLSFDRKRRDYIR